MKDIKFRAKRLDSGEWAYGFIYRHEPPPQCIVPKDHEREQPSFAILKSGFSDWNMPRPVEQWEVDGNTVGQFIGYPDAQGEDLYDGDILKGNHKDAFVIERINGGSQMYNIKYFGAKHNELISEATCDPQTKSWLSNAKKIGNIYDNPELIIK
jgi:hypothetical protein